jgi:hypothetical protein
MPADLTVARRAPGAGIAARPNLSTPLTDWSSGKCQGSGFALVSGRAHQVLLLREDHPLGKDPTTRACPGLCVIVIGPDTVLVEVPPRFLFTFPFTVAADAQAIEEVD